uniref:Ovule protein n=1 Tax=Angiostrongylus cantonensis TaxID=6313 RepID=A0A0K0DRV2_ANGCA
KRTIARSFPTIDTCGPEFCKYLSFIKVIFRNIPLNMILEKKGLVNGISRLLNIVAPVENSLCTFPPSLFNIQG